MHELSVIPRFFQDGGFFMYPIAAVLAVGIAIGIERWIYLTKVKFGSLRFWNQVVPMLSSGKLKEAAALTSRSNTAIGTIMSYGLARIHNAKRRDDVEKAMEESLMEVMPRLEKRTHYIGTFANIATLLGLLGTIMGLIAAFSAVATANSAEKATLLSASISVAMNCTAFGLIVAITLVLVHAFLQTKTTELVDSLEMASVKFLNLVTEGRSEPVAQ